MDNKVPKSAESTNPAFAAEREKTGQHFDPVNFFKAAFGIALMSTLSGCATDNEGRELALQAKIADLQQTLSHCQERSLEDNGAPVIISYGTLGVGLIRPGVENNLTVSSGFSGEVEQTFLIWPPANHVEDIKLEGDASHFSWAKVGSQYAMIFKSPVANKKEAVVIDVGTERYVLFIRRR